MYTCIHTVYIWQLCSLFWNLFQVNQEKKKQSNTNINANAGKILLILLLVYSNILWNLLKNYITTLCYDIFCKHVRKKKIHCFCSININKRMQSKKVSDKFTFIFCQTENFISTSGLFNLPFFHKCTFNYSLKSFCGSIRLKYRSVP